MVYNLSERFHSIQGEGLHVGLPMHFVRVAGCNVGVFSRPEAMDEGPLKVLRQEHSEHSICTPAIGAQFLCDTKYNRTVAKMSEDEILADTFEKDLCITGGEPLLYDLRPLVMAAQRNGVAVHIETSGTLPIPADLERDAWITCSPKHGFIEANAPCINEYKLLVDRSMSKADIEQLQSFHELAWSWQAELYLQPVNGIEAVFKDNVAFALQLLRDLPFARLSVQLHKLIGVL